MSELEGKYFGVLAELAPALPIVSANIKKLCGGTSETIRKAHAPDVSTLVTKTFLNL